MSDLIRRKDVAEFLFNNRMCTSINNAYDQLKCIPTAHDPEKVVEQLKEASYTETQDDMNPCDPSEVINLESAIEIVRGGGVDG